MSLEKQINTDSQTVEVAEKQRRRRFTADDKRRIVQEAENCKKPGELTALLRREGIYWTYLSNWRKQYKTNGLAPTKRGPKAASADEHKAKEKIRSLEREVARLTARAERAEALVDLQKKVAALLMPVKTEDQ